MNYLKKRIKKIILQVIMLALILNPTLLFAQYGLDETAKVGYGATTYAKMQKSDIKLTIANIIQIVLQFLGIIFLVLIIYGGLMWMISSGDQEKVTKARKILSNATLGLAIVLMAYMITYFIVSALATAVTANP